MTATEVLERYKNANKQLNDIYERLQHELLESLINNALRILSSNSKEKEKEK